MIISVIMSEIFASSQAAKHWPNSQDMIGNFCWRMIVVEGIIQDKSVIMMNDLRENRQ
jgi:hypothetical protein